MREICVPGKFNFVSLSLFEGLLYKKIEDEKVTEMNEGRASYRHNGTIKEQVLVKGK